MQGFTSIAIRALINNKMAAKILEVCKVTPPPKSPADMCIPLSFFDLIWLRFPPVELLFFYESPSLPDTFLSRLKHSLSLTLQHFLPLAGNLIWPPSAPNPVICYKKGDGVLFTVAHSDADFFHISSNNFRKTKIFRPLVAEIIDSESQVPILAVKVTVFPNKGFCIGITGHHVAWDGAVSSMFLKLWASISNIGESGNLSPELIPLFDRNPIRERYPQLEDLYINQLLNQDVANPRSLAITKVVSPPDRIRGTFQFSALDIKMLKEFVRKYDGVNHGIVFTTFTVIVAYIIVCSVKAKEMMENKVDFAIVVDCRARLEPPLSPNYAGNCIGFAFGDVQRDKLLGDDGIIAAVNAVHKMRKSLDDGVLKGVEKWLMSSDEELETDGISIAGSTNLEWYSLDFGTGRLKKGDMTSIDKTGAICLVEGRDGEGIEMELALTKYEMEKFASAFAQGLNKVKHIKAAL